MKSLELKIYRGIDLFSMSNIRKYQKLRGQKGYIEPKWDSLESSYKTEDDRKQGDKNCMVYVGPLQRNGTRLLEHMAFAGAPEGCIYMYIYVGS